MTDGALPVQARRRTINPILKLFLEMGPLALFFIAYSVFGRDKATEVAIAGVHATPLQAATGVMMVTVVVTLGVSYALLRRIPIMPLVTAVIVCIFGALAFDLPQ